MALLLEAEFEAATESTATSTNSTANEDTEDDDPGPSGINPLQELNARVTHALVAGEYYRDLSANYAEYHRSGDWPEHPFPNERNTWQTLDF